LAWDVTSIKEVLSRFNLIIAQSVEDQQNFNQLTNKEVLVYKNLKFNQQIASISKLEKTLLLNQLGLNNKKIISLISSRHGEEDLFLDAMKNFLNHKDYALIIVPRHPQRFQEVKNIIQKKGYSFNAMSSRLKRKTSVPIVIGDTMGEVYKYIGLSDLVFIGGSFKDYGSHSPIESILLKKPVIVGPSIFNFKSIINSGLKDKVFVQIKPEQISETIKKFFEEKYNSEFKANINVFLKENQKDEDKLIKLISKYF
jgi:3-deoxy-D-manno-octulosonic-acid transferase